MMIFIFYNNKKRWSTTIWVIGEARGLIYVCVLGAGWTSPSKVLLRYAASWQQLITHMTNRQSQRMLKRKRKRKKKWLTYRGIDHGFSRGDSHIHPPRTCGGWFLAGGFRVSGNQVGRSLITVSAAARRKGQAGVEEEASLKSMIHCITNHARTQRLAGEWQTDTTSLPYSISFYMDVFLLE